MNKILSNVIKPVLYITFVSLLVFSLKAQQNLVPNGSFEEYNWCPNSVDGFYINACKYWTMPTLGTSDYFNTCSVEIGLDGYEAFSVPRNYIGFQESRTGNGYAGISYTQIEAPNVPSIEQTYSEYIQIKLTQKLVKNKMYNLKFYVSNAFSNICGNSIGAFFSSDELNVLNDYNLNVSNNFQSDLSFFFCDSTKWFELEYIFFSDGTEEYLIIGIFTELHESKTSDYSGNIISGPGLYGANQYFYIDDVSLFEVDFNIPNVFTPNNDGVNDIFKIDGLLDDFSLTILNRWGEKVFETNNANMEFWNGETNGCENSTGVYFYVLGNKNNDNKKTGFVHLIR